MWIRLTNGPLTSEGIDGAIFKLHKGVKGPAAADLCVWVRGLRGGCFGRNSAGLSSCVSPGSFGCDGHVVCVGRTCNFFIYQSWGSGHVKSGLWTLMRTVVGVWVRPSAGLSLTTRNCERLLFWWSFGGWSGAFKHVVFILCKVKRVSTSWRGQKGLESKSFSGFMRISAWFWGEERRGFLLIIPQMASKSKQQLL